MKNKPEGTLPPCKVAKPTPSTWQCYWEGEKAFAKGLMLICPRHMWQNSPRRLLGQLAPSRDRAAVGALKPPTAPLRHRKLSNRLTKGLLITREPGGGKLIPRINRIIARCLFPVLCLSHSPEFIPPWCCTEPIARNVNAAD